MLAGVSLGWHLCRYCCRRGHLRHHRASDRSVVLTAPTCSRLRLRHHPSRSACSPLRQVPRMVRRPPRCEQRRRQGDAVPRRTLRIAADWFPPPAMKLTRDLGGRYRAPHLLMSQDLARNRTRHRNGRRHSGKVAVPQSQNRLSLLPRDTRAQDQRRSSLQDAASAIANSLHGVAVRRGRRRCARPTHATEADSILTGVDDGRAAANRQSRRQTHKFPLRPIACTFATERQAAS